MNRFTILESRNGLSNNLNVKRKASNSFKLRTSFARPAPPPPGSPTMNRRTAAAVDEVEDAGRGTSPCSVCVCVWDPGF